MEVSGLVGAWNASDFAEPSTEAVPTLTHLQQVVRCTTELVETERSHMKVCVSKELKADPSSDVSL